MITIKTIPVSDFAQNARILSCLETGEIMLVDPGFEIDKLLQGIDLSAIKHVLLTHAHIDHAAHCEYVLQTLEKKFGVSPVFYAHQAEALMRQSLPMQAQMYGISDPTILALREPDVYLAGGQSISLGNTELNVLFTPGHSPGHVSVYIQSGVKAVNDLRYKNEAFSGSLCIAGDALFRQSIGRTDLPGGNHHQLLTSIKQELFALPGDTLVLTGHGPHTHIAFEKENNPFLQ